MRNLKKMAALGAAAVMALSVNVSAFAAVTATSTNANFGSYESGVAKLANTDMIDSENQWTVVIIDADKATANLTAEDLYYINQGTSADDFWLTNGMGTKIDLNTLVSETTPTKNFIIRIGGETISDVTGIIEIPFVINYSAGTPTWTYGDVDGIEGVSANDATTVLKHVALISELTGDNLKAADVDGIDGVSANDATTILKKVALLIDKFPVEK